MAQNLKLAIFLGNLGIFVTIAQLVDMYSALKYYQIFRIRYTISEEL